MTGRVKVTPVLNEQKQVCCLSFEIFGTVKLVTVTVEGVTHTFNDPVTIKDIHIAKPVAEDVENETGLEYTISWQ